MLVTSLIYYVGLRGRLLCLQISARTAIVCLQPGNTDSSSKFDTDTDSDSVCYVSGTRAWLGSETNSEDESEKKRMRSLSTCKAVSIRIYQKS